MPNSFPPPPQSGPYRIPNPIRVLPANPDGIELTRAHSLNGDSQIIVPSTISLGRGGPYPAIRLDICADRTFDFRSYGDTGDLTFALQSNPSGSLYLLPFPYGGTDGGWRVSVDTFMEYCLKRAPRGGDL